MVGTIVADCQAAVRKFPDKARPALDARRRPG